MKISAIRYGPIFPLLFAFVAFVLGLLCMFAGNKPGFMEDYHIVTINTTVVGTQIVQKVLNDTTTATTSASKIATATSSTAQPSKSSSLFGITVPSINGRAPIAERSPIDERSTLDERFSVSDIGTSISNTIKNLTSEVDALADKLDAKVRAKVTELLNKGVTAITRELGIQQFYSLHLMTMCDGNYTLNGTLPGAKKAGSVCSKQTAMYHFDIQGPVAEELANATSKFPTELKTFFADKLTTENLGIDKIQDGLNTLSTALNATFVFYAIAIASAGTLFLVSLLAIFANVRILSFISLFLSFISMFTFMVASAIVTEVQKKATKYLNEYGNEIGLYAYKGGKFLILTWVAFALVAVAFLYCLAEFFMGRRAKKQEYNEKRVVKTGMLGKLNPFGGRRHSDEMSLRRSGV
ncbi:actin cortical patch SUR7/pH-response regulator pali [Halenospora varia]|nr:actin cortical patch SUR7/pH-response regulator pali [Halenospora varia]